MATRLAFPLFAGVPIILLFVGTAPGEPQVLLEPNDRIVVGLNVRAHPSADAEIVAVIRPGDRVTQVSSTAFWYQVRSAAGTEGWAAKVYLRVVTSPAPPLRPIDASAHGAAGREARRSSSELTIHLTGQAGWPQTSPLLIRLAALGKPPTQPVRLADAEGRNEAIVTFPENRCSKEELRYTSLGTDEWCLEVQGLAPGSASGATIITEKITLKLEVGVRHNFWSLPLLVTVGSLVVGLVVTWLTTDYVPSFLTKKLVDNDVAVNQARPENQRITDLQEWVMQRRQGTSDKTLLPLLKTLLAYGPTQAQQARQRLRQAVDQSPLPNPNPIRREAAHEADKTRHSITDFYSDGTRRERHPADEWILTLNRAQGIQRQLGRARTTIAALPPDQRRGLPELFDDAERVFQEAGDATGLSFTEETLRDLWRKIHDHIADLPEGERAAFFKASAVHPIEAIQPVVTDRPSQVSSLPILVPERLAHLLEAGALTLATIVLLVSIAAGAVASASYLPKATFGTCPDYLALFFSGFGSTTAAGILLVLLVWKQTTRT